MSWGFCGFERFEGREENYPFATKGNLGATTPPVGHPFVAEGEFSAFGLHSPSLEGVARSDGVVAPESLTRSDGVVVPESMTRSDGVVAPELETHKLSQLPYNPALKQRARELRKAGNLSEVLFWNVVKNKQLNGQDFDRQRVIGNYIVDFYCHEHALVVEIDGSSHNDKQAYDQVRDEYLEALGLKVLHVHDVDVKQNLAGVVELVRQQLESTTPSLRATPSKEGE